MLSLSHTLYPLFYILFISLSFSLPPTFSFSQLQCYSIYRGLPRALGLAGSCAAGTIPEALQVSGAGARYAIAGVPAPLQVSGADSLMSGREQQY